MISVEHTRQWGTIPPMSAARFTVIQIEHLDPAPAAWLAERAELVVRRFDAPGFDAVLARADGLIVRTYTQVNADLLDAAPNLKVVGRAGVSLENIEVAECRRRGIEVVHAPESNSQAVVEYVVCLVTDALRPRARVERAMPLDEWERLRAEVFAHRQIDELTVGILGLGRIGRRVARVFRALGCEVIYNDIRRIPAEETEGAHCVTIEELFERSDVLSIHVDARPGNRHVVSRSLIERMKPDVLLVNTSRGLAIDHAALAAFLVGHPTAQALLDVHDPEPPPMGYPLFGVANVVLLPHLAGRTQTALINMSWVVRDVWEVLEGRVPRFAAPEDAL